MSQGRQHPNPRQVRVCVVGANGSFGSKHVEAISTIAGAEVTTAVGHEAEALGRFASDHGIAQTATTLADVLGESSFDAVILASPTPLHADQAIACLDAGKHVLIEIPMAETLRGSLDIVERHRGTGLIAMVGHIRRFDHPHHWIHQQIRSGRLRLQQLQVNTHFMRRRNTNARGEHRSWTDHLLWHHACHSIDLFQYQTGESCDEVVALGGPDSPQLGIALDLTIGARTSGGALLSLSLSFNHDGPFGSTFRYICDHATHVVRDDTIVDGSGQPVELEPSETRSGLELMDQAFIDSIRSGQSPNASVESVLPAMTTLDRIDRLLSRRAV